MPDRHARYKNGARTDYHPGSVPFDRSTPWSAKIRSTRPSCRTVPTVRFSGNCCPVGPIEPIEVKGHDKPVSRYRENHPISPCSIFLMFLVHNFFLRVIHAASNSVVSALGATFFGSTRIDETP